MRYIVIERYRRGADPVYARAKERGRMLPDGLTYVDSWIDERTLDRCYQLMETDDARLLRLIESGREDHALTASERNSSLLIPRR